MHIPDCQTWYDLAGEWRRFPWPLPSTNLHAKEAKTVADIKAGKLIPEWLNKTLAERGCTMVE